MFTYLNLEVLKKIHQIRFPYGKFLLLYIGAQEQRIELAQSKKIKHNIKGHGSFLWVSLSNIIWFT
jgi:hypothetical protein